MTFEEATRADTAEAAADSSPDAYPAAPPLPVLLRVPRFADLEACPDSEVAATGRPRRRRGRRLAARLALVALLAGAATPWLIRWRPWQHLELTGRLPGFSVTAGEKELGEPAERRYAPAPAAAAPAADASAEKPRPARLVPDIIPLENENGDKP
jgi:hypothetical protein